MGMQDPGYIAGLVASVSAALLILPGGRSLSSHAHGEDAPNAYAIGIGDVLEISVWKNPDLTTTVPVRPDGRISVPLLGDVQAAGMTPLALKQSLTDGYKEYVTAPGVSVVVKEIHSRKIFVTGEVAHPGTFDLEPRTKLMQALALAGGVTPYAKGQGGGAAGRPGRPAGEALPGRHQRHRQGQAAAGQPPPAPRRHPDRALGSLPLPPPFPAPGGIVRPARLIHGDSKVSDVFRRVTRGADVQQNHLFTSRSN